MQRSMKSTPLSQLAAAGAALVVCLCANAWAADPPGSALPAYSAQRAFGYLEVLAGQIGERPAGTEAEGRAVEYISKQFRAWGLDTTLEAIKVPVWHERRVRFWADGDRTFDFPAKAVVFSGLTSPEGLSGEFADIGTASARDLKGRNLKGKIVLIKRDAYEDYPDIWLTDKLAPLGVAGMIFFSSPGRSGIPTVYFNFKRALKERTLPSVDIRYEDAVRLVQMHPKRVSMVVQGDVEWRESHSVIGEIKGTVKPDEIVLVTAHDDTAYTSPGAFDDTGGVAAVMELARTFAAGPRPARTMRFICWGGHELGLMGSETYLRARQAEVAKTVAIINYDGLGATLGTLEWTGTGDDAWFQFLRQTQNSLGLDDTGTAGPTGTDVTNFSSLEIPGVQIGLRGGSGQSHTPDDNLQSMSAVGLEDGLAFAAAVAHRLGTDTTLKFPHHFPPPLLQQVRDYAARWGWGVRPEANEPPRVEH
jgi:carboxypeptidase Q